jgi:uncharacterized protein (TIGR02246 family)
MPRMLREISSKIVGAAAVAVLLTHAGAALAADTFADDRAKIEQLEARYLFAMDFRDPDAYASCFAENGVLSWAGGVVEGREAIREFIRNQHSQAGWGDTKEAAGSYPPTARHFLTNLVVHIDGDHGSSRAYWFEMGNNNPTRKVDVGAYGHFENELVKKDGEWYFVTRTIFNEQLANKRAKGGNPAPWH